MFVLKGILFKLAATACFAVMAALIRHIGERLPVGQVVFARSFFALLPLLAWLAVTGQMASAVRMRDPRAHLLRGLTGVGSMVFMFIGLALLPLAEATALGFAMPLMSVVFAAIFLGETVRIYRWSAVAVGFVGVVIMLWPRLADSAAVLDKATLGALAALTGATLAGAAVVQIRSLTRTEETAALVFSFSIITTLVGLATAPFGWVWPDAGLAAALVGTGIAGGTAQILMTQSYRYADASLLAPFDYAAMIWAILIGWLVFHEWPTLTVLAGAVVVIAAGLFVIWREHRLGLVRRREVETTLPD